MRSREAVMSLLIGAGFGPQDAVRLHLVVTSMQLEVRFAARTAAERRQVRELFASQDPERFGTVVAHAGVLAEHRTDDEFEFGLRAILDGVQSRRRPGARH
jgi:hypothetical protein